MSEHEENDLDRIEKRLVGAVASDMKRPRAVHEAGHAVVALDLGLPLDSVNIVERDEADGPKFGRAIIKPLCEIFPANEIQDRSQRVIEHVHQRIIFLHAGEAATMLILERPHDPLAQSDQSMIARAFRDFPELVDARQELIEAAREKVRAHRAAIEQVADALMKQTSLTAAEVQQIVAGR